MQKKHIFRPMIFIFRLPVALVCTMGFLPLSGQDNTYTETVNGVSFTMVRVQGGTFTMGCTGEQGGDCESNESPAPRVTLSNYSIGETEVTQALWYVVMDFNPSISNPDCFSCPVEYVSWEQAQEFIRELNAMTGKRYRLPTEAEWEYAARGGAIGQGNKYSGSHVVYKVAWMTENAEGKTHPVKGKKPNELGLYDMSGNVWEWCSDWYGSYPSYSQTNPTGPASGSFRVFRGGGWGGNPQFCRVSRRDGGTPDSRRSYLGFRLASQ